MKVRHPAQLVLLRVGDYYEAYGADAERMAAALGLTLTSHGGLPLAGAPAHSIERYTGALAARGIEVVLVDPQPDATLAGEGAPQP